MVGASLGVAIAATLWWLYFDIVAIVAEHRMKQARGGERARIARDSYSYIHFFMIAGIVLLALGIKKVLLDTGEPLKLVPAVALCAGPGALPAGPHRLPAAQRPHAEPAATRRSRSSCSR